MSLQCKKLRNSGPTSGRITKDTMRGRLGINNKKGKTKTWQTNSQRSTLPH